MLNSARANTNFAYSANFASPAHFVASLRRRRLPVFLARRSLPCQFLFSSLFFVLRYRLLATSYWLLPCGEINVKVTVPAVLRLCGVPRGITSMSPLWSVIVVAPSDSGASHSPAFGLCAFFGVPPSS